MRYGISRIIDYVTVHRPSEYNYGMFQYFFMSVLWNYSFQVMLIGRKMLKVKKKQINVKKALAILLPINKL